MEALGISLGYLLTFALSFGILFVVLRAWVYGPMLNMLSKRREAIGRGLEDARVAAEARANAEKEANRVLSEAQTKAAEVIRDATERAGSVEKEIRVQAEAETAKERQAAMNDLEGERNRMLSEVRGQIVSLTVAATRKLLHENLDEQRQSRLVNEFFTGLKDGKMQLFSGVDLTSVTNAQITSALPLTADEQQTVQAQLMPHLSDAAAVNFRVDPSILGGLVVRVGDQVMDNSVAGQLEELHQSMR